MRLAGTMYFAVDGITVLLVLLLSFILLEFSAGHWRRLGAGISWLNDSCKCSFFVTIFQVNSVIVNWIIYLLDCICIQFEVELTITVQPIAFVPLFEFSFLWSAVTVAPGDVC